MEFTSLPIPFDFWTLRLIWWLVLGVLVAGYCITQGYDLGVSIMMPFVSKSDTERRILINTVAPFWEGSQVWLILGGGAAFAAWPYLYAVAFSGLYMVLFIVLFSVIIRPVGFKFRSKMPDATWRSVWDWGLFVGAFIPTVLLGVGIGNFLENGFSFSFDDNMRLSFGGAFMDLLTPYTLLWGVLMVLLFVRHGAGFLMFKTDDSFKSRLASITFVTNVLSLLLGSYLVVKGLGFGFQFDQSIAGFDLQGASNPLLKPETIIKHTSWYANLFQTGGLGRILILWLCPILLVLGFLGVQWGLHKKCRWGVFISSSVNMLGLVATFGWMTFPILLPSKNLRHSLTVYDASSSRLTLFVMLLATIIFLPIILSYTAWVYRVLTGPVVAKDIESNGENLY